MTLALEITLKFDPVFIARLFHIRRLDIDIGGDLANKNEANSGSGAINSHICKNCGLREEWQPDEPCAYCGALPF
jgi:hypothetical protein